MTTPQSLSELFAIDTLLDAEEIAIRDTVRKMVDDRIRPHVGEWFEAAALPARELAKELGALGVLGMHLEGYGCAGMSATAYGLACQELEAVDSGIRSLVSVQGSLAMFAIHHNGSEEQKEEWLPRMAAGEAIGCFGLTEPDFGSNPGGMRTNAKRDGDDWILNGTKMWITNGSIADVAVVWARTDDGVRGFVVPTDTPGFSAPEIKNKMSLRASVTSELVLEDVRLPASAMLPKLADCPARSAASTRHASASSSGQWVQHVTASRLRSHMHVIARSSTSRSPRIRSPRPRSPTWQSNWARGSCSPSTSGASRTPGRFAPSRSAPASSTMSARPSRSPVNAEPFWAPTASRSSIP